MTCYLIFSNFLAFPVFANEIDREGVFVQHYANGKIKEKALYVEDQVVWIKRFNEKGNILPKEDEK